LKSRHLEDGTVLLFSCWQCSMCVSEAATGGPPIRQSRRRLLFCKQHSSCMRRHHRHVLCSMRSDLLIVYLNPLRHLSSRNKFGFFLKLAFHLLPLRSHGTQSTFSGASRNFAVRIILPFTSRSLKCLH